MNMEWRKEWKALLLMIGLFLLSFYLPVGIPRFDNAITESLHLVKWYAQEHVILCLVPAFFIAGAIGVFVSQASVMKYLGARANKVLSYGVASVSGTILAVCSCTVLPLYAGIYQMGAGLGPATAFLYSGPAINVLAIVLTARVLGFELGVARAVGAVVFSVIVGLLMHFIFRKEETDKANAQMSLPETVVRRPLWQNIIYFGTMVAILIFANWARPADAASFWFSVYLFKWQITSAFSVLFATVLFLWFGLELWKITLAAVGVIVGTILFPYEPMVPFAVGIVGLSIITSTHKGEAGEWFSQTWGFAKQILPLLLFGILIAGALLGRPGKEGIIPSEWVAAAVGGNSVWANLFASVAGAFMYFATLTEVPILQGLIGSGMGKGPALSLLLAGPTLSLPSMLVLNSIMGTKKTVVYVTLVIVIATITGLLYGAIY